MLWDAFFAETYRLARSRTTWFWSVFFVPILGLVMSVIGNAIVKANESKLMADEKMPPEVALAFVLLMILIFKRDGLRDYRCRNADRALRSRSQPPSAGWPLPSTR